MQSIFKIFQTLQIETSYQTDSFNIIEIPNVKYHKMGISMNRQPMFFIKCDDALKIKALDINLELISVQFNRECQLFSNDKKNEDGIYSIIALKTDSNHLQAYFLEIVFVVIQQLPEIPKFKELKIEVEKLINLFSTFSKPPAKTIQGLWAELLVIEQSKKPDYLIQSWHQTATDKFDFNDGNHKIEVKSTAKSKRIHHFSIDQLHPNPNSIVLIASVFTIEIGIGKNIMDLVQSIEKKLKNKQLFFRLNEILAQTIGKDFEKTFEIFYDYQLAIDTLQFYNSEDIPKININNIPKSVMNIRFDCDLTEVDPVKKTKTKSLLHNALF